MVSRAKRRLLFIEPSSPATDVRVVDELTRRMTGALRTATRGTQYRGCHDCVCGERSSSCDFIVASSSGKLITNSLAVHYLARHRAEVPESELHKVTLLTAEPCDPTPAELGYHEPSTPIRFPG